MNERQQYEKHLAEKFQQLPIPDVEPNWQQMKSLLDNKMPRGGVYWKWFAGIGIIILMLSGATWIMTNQNEPTVASKHPEIGNAGGKKQNTVTESPEEHSLSKDDALRQQQNSSPPVEVTTGKNTSPSQKEPSNKNTTIDKTLPTQSTRSEKKLSNESTKSRTQTSKPLAEAQEPNRINHVERFKGDPLLQTAHEERIREARTSVDGEVYAQPKTRADRLNKASTGITDEYVAKIPSAIKVSNPELNVDMGKAVGDSINHLYYSGLFPQAESENGKNQAKSKLQKSKDILAVENRSLALGFSLPLGFPLGDQKPGAYNINARPNVISDFLPVPHMQYHINSKVYLQTELQLMNPQYIQPVLLYQAKNEVQTTNTVYYNSVYAKKLYYFNIPVGIHYSPFHHFYLGTGLQFSSLVSGVALHEQTSATIGSTRYNVVSQQYAKFKNDTLSQRIDNNEFRLMLDANYYWRQFTVGLRYNQALSNYVSLRLNTGSPLFQDKNKSLQFYLRYNLWEKDRKPSILKLKK